MTLLLPPIVAAATVTDALGREWDPTLHPRDRKGKFIHTFRKIRAFLADDSDDPWATGSVVKINDNGSVRMRVENVADSSNSHYVGQMVDLAPSTIENINEKATLSTAQKSKTLGTYDFTHDGMRDFFERAGLDTTGGGDLDKAQIGAVNLTQKKGYLTGNRARYHMALYAKSQSGDDKPHTNAEYMQLLQNLDVDSDIADDTPDGMSGLQWLANEENASRSPNNNNMDSADWYRELPPTGDGQIRLAQRRDSDVKIAWNEDGTQEVIWPDGTVELHDKAKGSLYMAGHNAHDAPGTTPGGEPAAADEQPTDVEVNTPNNTPTPLTWDQMDAVEEYVVDSQAINTALRNDVDLTSDDDLRETVDVLDDLIANNIVPANTTLYRGMSFESDDPFMANLVPGAVIGDKAYVSMTDNESSAENFAGFSTDRSRVVFAIDLDADTPGYRINEDEEEFLLPRNTNFEVIDVSQDADGVYRVRARLTQANASDVEVPADEPAAVDVVPSEVIDPADLREFADEIDTLGIDDSGDYSNALRAIATGIEDDSFDAPEARAQLNSFTDDLVNADYNDQESEDRASEIVDDIDTLAEKLTGAPSAPKAVIPDDEPDDGPVGLTADQYEALDEYISASDDVNDTLRYEVPDGAQFTGDLKKMVDALDGLIDDSLIPEGTILYRGMHDDDSGNYDDFLDTIEPGAILSDKAYLSTSSNPALAEQFMEDEEGTGSPSVLFEITPSPGAKGFYIDGNPAVSNGEDEYLLPRSTRLRIDTVEVDENGNHRVSATILLGDEDESSTEIVEPADAGDTLPGDGDAAPEEQEEAANLTEVVADFVSGNGNNTHVFTGPDGTEYVLTRSKQKAWLDSFNIILRKNDGKGQNIDVWDTSKMSPDEIANAVVEAVNGSGDSDPVQIGVPDGTVVPGITTNDENDTMPADIIDATNWTQVGGQGGSNLGGFFEAPDGTRYYVKQPQTEHHAKNEVLAANFYDILGIDVPEMSLADTPFGGTGVASKIIDGAESNLLEHLNDQDYLEKLHKGFAVDAWLANWDVAGLDYDNVVTDVNGVITNEAGDPVRIDLGGALWYRAMGSPKGDAFGDEVLEIDRYKTKGNASKIYGSIDPETEMESALRVMDISPEQIDQLVDSFDFSNGDVDGEKLKATLKARRAFIADHYGLPLPENENHEDNLPPEDITEEEATAIIPEVEDVEQTNFGFSTNYGQVVTADNYNENSTYSFTLDTDMLRPMDPGELNDILDNPKIIIEDQDSENGHAWWAIGGEGKDLFDVYSAATPADYGIDNFYNKLELLEAAPESGDDQTPTPEPPAPSTPGPSSTDWDAMVDADGPYRWGKNGQKVRIGMKVRSDKDGLEGTIYKFEKNHDGAVVLGTDGKKKGRKLKTLTILDEPEPEQTPEPVPAPEPDVVPDTTPAPVPEGDWYLGTPYESDFIEWGQLDIDYNSGALSDNEAKILAKKVAKSVSNKVFDNNEPIGSPAEKFVNEIVEWIDDLNAPSQSEQLPDIPGDGILLDSEPNVPDENLEDWEKELLGIGPTPAPPAAYTPELAAEVLNGMREGIPKNTPKVTQLIPGITLYQAKQFRNAGFAMDDLTTEPTGSDQWNKYADRVEYLMGQSGSSDYATNALANFKVWRAKAIGADTDTTPDVDDAEVPEGTVVVYGGTWTKNAAGGWTANNGFTIDAGDGDPAWDKLEEEGKKAVATSTDTVAAPDSDVAPSGTVVNLNGVDWIKQPNGGWTTSSGWTHVDDDDEAAQLLEQTHANQGAASTTAEPVAPNGATVFYGGSQWEKLAGGDWEASYGEVAEPGTTLHGNVEEAWQELNQPAASTSDIPPGSTIDYAGSEWTKNGSGDWESLDEITGPPAALWQNIEEAYHNANGGDAFTGEEASPGTKVHYGADDWIKNVNGGWDSTNGYVTIDKDQTAGSLWSNIEKEAQANGTTPGATDYPAGATIQLYDQTWTKQSDGSWKSENDITITEQNDPWGDHKKAQQAAKEKYGEPGTASSATDIYPPPGSTVDYAGLELTKQPNGSWKTKLNSILEENDVNGEYDIVQKLAKQKYGDPDASDHSTPATATPSPTPTPKPKVGPNKPGADGKPIYIGDKVKSDKDGLIYTVLKFEANGTGAVLLDPTGKKRARKLSTLRTQEDVVKPPPPPKPEPHPEHPMYGKDKPEPPTAPDTPSIDGYVEDSWLQSIKDEYQTKFSKPIEDSKNWHRYQAVVTQGDRDQLQYLKNKNFITQDQFDDASAQIQAIHDQQEASVAAYKALQIEYAKNLNEWAYANGYMGADHPQLYQLKGMAGAKEFSSKSSGATWGKKIWGEFNKTVAPSVHSAIESYTGSSYQEINGDLQNAKEKSLDPSHHSVGSYTKKIDQYLEAAPRVPEDIVVVRGNGFTGWVDPVTGKSIGSLSASAKETAMHNLKGTVQVNWGFQSATPGDEPGYSDSKAVWMKIRVPAGAKAGYVSAGLSSQGEGEYEILLDRGWRMYVHNVYKGNPGGQWSGQKWIVEVEVVPPGWIPPMTPGGTPAFDATGAAFLPGGPGAADIFPI